MVMSMQQIKYLWLSGRILTATVTPKSSATTSSKPSPEAMYSLFGERVYLKTRHTHICCSLNRHL